MNDNNTTSPIDHPIEAFAGMVVADPLLAAKLAACGPGDFAAACLSAARDRGLALDAAALARASRPAVRTIVSLPDDARGFHRQRRDRRKPGAQRLHLSHVTLRLDLGDADDFSFTGLLCDFRGAANQHGLKLTSQIPGGIPTCALRAIVAAYGRRRAGNEKRCVIKLDSWHTCALPAFQHAFPNVPWVFLYRDPVEVLVSQSRQAGAQLVPSLVAPETYGLEQEEARPGPDYAARVLGRICAAAAEHLPHPRGIAVNYRDLPAAVESRILPHFGIATDAAERELVAAAAQRDAKQPFATFTNDSASKNAEATPELRALADQHLGHVIKRLEAVNTAL